MVPLPTWLSIPTAGATASISTTGLNMSSLYVPNTLLPAEHMNYFLNGFSNNGNVSETALSNVISEMLTILTAASISPNGSLTNQVYAALNALYVPVTAAVITAAKVLTIKNSMTLQGTDGNRMDTDAIIRTVYQGLAVNTASTTTFTVSSGCVGDSGFVSTMLLASAITKSTSAWAVGSSNGGLDTGAIGASTTYYVYVIKRPDTQVVDVLFSLSATAPTMPTNYTLKRLVGALFTNGSSQFVPSIGYQDGTQMWTTLTQDVNDATLTTSRKTYTVATLPNIRCLVTLNLSINNAASVVVDLYGDNNLTDSSIVTTGPVVAKSKSQVSGVSTASYISGMIFNGNSLYARASAASTTIQVSIVSFNVRPYN